MDFSHVKGQHHAKRALAAAVAGAHGILLIGPKGQGKTMLSAAISSLGYPIRHVTGMDALAGPFHIPVTTTLVAEAWPCPCGGADFLKSPVRMAYPVPICTCTPEAILAHAQALRPIYDQVDIVWEVPSVAERDGSDTLLSSDHMLAVAKAIKAARGRQAVRWGAHMNGQAPEPISPSTTLGYHNSGAFDLSESAFNLLRLGVRKLHLAPEDEWKVWRLARTLADLEETTHPASIGGAHVAEALQYQMGGPRSLVYTNLTEPTPTAVEG